MTWCRFWSAAPALARTWANELAPRGIRVNVVAPGPTDTAMFAAASDAVRKTLTALIPLGRMARAEEVAAAALFLASDESSFITGAELPWGRRHDAGLSHARVGQRRPNPFREHHHVPAHQSSGLAGQASRGHSEARGVPPCRRPGARRRTRRDAAAQSLPVARSLHARAHQGTGGFLRPILRARCAATRRHGRACRRNPPQRLCGRRLGGGPGRWLAELRRLERDRPAPAGQGRGAAVSGARHQPGETLVVSAAAGAVGSVAGQVARLLGCRVVGVAGGATKCRAVVGELGFDACLDYRAPDLAARLRQAAPDGIDIYFENVGGPVREAVWPLLNIGARVPVCGLVSSYNGPSGASDESVHDLLMSLILRRVRVQGFMNGDHAGAGFAAFEAQMQGWLDTAEFKPARRWSRASTGQWTPLSACSQDATSAS